MSDRELDQHTRALHTAIQQRAGSDLAANLAALVRLLAHDVHNRAGVLSLDSYSLREAAKQLRALDRPADGTKTESIAALMDEVADSLSDTQVALTDTMASLRAAVAGDS